MDTQFELDPALLLEAVQLKKAHDFWGVKKGQRLAPSRDQFNLRETLSFAPHLQILDLLEQAQGYRQRLTGTAVVAQLKEDPTGRTYLATSEDPIVRRMMTAIRWVLENKEPLRTVAHRTALPGQDFVRHETLFLPLSSDDRHIDMMAVVSSFTPVAKSPAS